ncbi:hypothetical protein C9F11_46375 (plasmid) [Streptomyces sp. YIM 121038]|uniref:hypothetical protein n=1 Tax=Streptomyces sp. YIM 121038 TaxID=2136401 RepID=UPI0011101BE6|nr:hypothetical protein [Streptomyces sp. YIM 121038]QCX82825.1 hypothetical protein C9F11_46375 [Streptomyces sp. YIM 121038]
MTILLQQTSQTLALRALRAWNDPAVPQSLAIAVTSTALREAGNLNGARGVQHLAMVTSQLAGLLWNDHQPDHCEGHLRTMLASALQQDAAVSSLVPRVLTVWAKRAAGQCGLDEAVAVTNTAYASAVQEQGAIGIHALYGATVCLTALLTSRQAEALGTTPQALLKGATRKLNRPPAGPAKGTV